MKKLVFAFAILLMCQVSYASDLGVTIHYAPTAGEFVKGTQGWTFLCDYTSVGAYSKIILFHTEDYAYGNNDIFLLIKDRAIFGTDIYQQSIFLVGNVLSAQLSLDSFVVLNYEFYTFWDKGRSNPVYMMQSGDVHKISVEINMPLLSF
jgi:hypothetical protein